MSKRGDSDQTSKPESATTGTAAEAKTTADVAAGLAAAVTPQKSAVNAKSPVGVNSAATKAEDLGQIASTLRHAYQSTLEEQIPESMLDLLRQLD